MPDPLLAPLAGLAAGLVLGRFFVFGARELLWAIGLLVVLTLSLPLWKSTRRVAMLGVPDGALVSRRAAGGDGTVPGRRRNWTPPPREVVILSGCVVNPPVFSEDARQFLLELGSRGTGAGQPGPEARATAARPALRAEGRDRRRAPRRIRNFRNPGSFD